VRSSASQGGSSLHPRGYIPSITSHLLAPPHAPPTRHLKHRTCSPAAQPCCPALQHLASLLAVPKRRSSGHRGETACALVAIFLASPSTSSHFPASPCTTQSSHLQHRTSITAPAALLPSPVHAAITPRCSAVLHTAEEQWPHLQPRSYISCTCPHHTTLHHLMHHPAPTPAAFLAHLSLPRSRLLPLLCSPLPPLLASSSLAHISFPCSAHLFLPCSLVPSWLTSSFLAHPTRIYTSSCLYTSPALAHLTSPYHLYTAPCPRSPLPACAPLASPLLASPSLLTTRQPLACLAMPAHDAPAPDPPPEVAPDHPRVDMWCNRIYSLHSVCVCNRVYV
jgi:hypothetical protein